MKATLITKRNDPRVNAHNRVMLQHWRANTDLQPIVDTEAAARYLCKYAVKGERRSHDAHAILNSCVGQSDDHNYTRSVLRRFMLRAVGQRDFSAQETAHLLMSEPLYACSFGFVTLSLNGSRLVLKTLGTDDGRQATSPSALEDYADRSRHENEFPDVTNINLVTFVANYSSYRGQLRREPKRWLYEPSPTSLSILKVPIMPITASTS